MSFQSKLNIKLSSRSQVSLSGYDMITVEIKSEHCSTFLLCAILDFKNDELLSPPFHLAQWGFWNWRLTSWGTGLPLPLDDKAATALCEEGRFLLLHHSRFTLTRSLICGWAFFTLARKCGHGPGDSLEDWLTKWVEKGEIEEQSEESSDGCPAVSSQYRKLLVWRKKIKIFYGNVEIWCLSASWVICWQRVFRFPLNAFASIHHWAQQSATHEGDILL